MNTLAIDTITPALSVSASGPKGTCTISIRQGGMHAASLVEIIDDAVARAGFNARETELVAVPEGPGSFTGLRLSWSAAKAISLAADCPLVTIPTLDAYAASFNSWTGPVFAVLDAKKSRFYARVFRGGEAVTEPMDIHASEMGRYVAEEERILVTGPDAGLFAEEASASFPLAAITAFPSGESGMSEKLLFLVQTMGGAYTVNVADQAGPLYVRRSDAEIENPERGS